MTTTTTTPARRSQPDDEIIDSLGISTGTACAFRMRIDRTDPYRYLLVSRDDSGVDGINGRVVMESAMGTRHEFWYLGCVECCTEITLTDGGMCLACRRA